MCGIVKLMLLHETGEARRMQKYFVRVLYLSNNFFEHALTLVVGGGLQRLLLHLLLVLPSVRRMHLRVLPSGHYATVLVDVNTHHRRRVHVSTTRKNTDERTQSS